MKNIRPVDIAKKLNISTSSLRGYEARGIVPPPARSSAGYRIYTEEHIAYFECIVAMSSGFGMDITSAVLKKLQRKELNDALWIINQAEVSNYESKKSVEKVHSYIEKVAAEMCEERMYMKVGEVSAEAQVLTTTLRYWEKEGIIVCKRHENNQYRLFDQYQFIKILLMKSMQHLIYSNETVRLKQAIKTLDGHDFQQAKKIASDIQSYLDTCNQKRLHGLFYLYRLCKVVDL
ncbi:MerR family transcriptional regulator [Priestia abyssalis]|uniref:MerR family transcriptional regulator n=1 Tax=Priestia abyssalis TaxID=1221450 RepID=UPI0009957DF9|nr:MerR family transcriptional regulator [Priestia abyssalis]